MCQGFSFFRAAKRPFSDPRSGAVKEADSREREQVSIDRLYLVGEGIDDARIDGKQWIELMGNSNPLGFRTQQKGPWITIEGEIGAADHCQVSEFVRAERPPNNEPRLNTDPFDQGHPGKGSQLRDFHELRRFQTRYDAAGMKRTFHVTHRATSQVPR
jgi:hypothetical protein